MQPLSNSHQRTHINNLNKESCSIPTHTHILTYLSMETTIMLSGMLITFLLLPHSPIPPTSPLPSHHPSLMLTDPLFPLHHPSFLIPMPPLCLPPSFLMFFPVFSLLPLLTPLIYLSHPSLSLSCFLPPAPYPLFPLHLPSPLTLQPLSSPCPPTETRYSAALWPFMVGFPLKVSCLHTSAIDGALTSYRPRCPLPLYV